jgi:pimeloyl-ACP methyl ester carboxylesterase
MRDLRPELRNFPVPVYARVGELDVGAPPAVSQEIVNLVQRGKLEVVPGCGHGLFIENLDGTVAAIASRIDSAAR